jgi:hypothetical protein
MSSADLTRTKTVEQSIQDTDEPGHRLRRRLSALDLTVFGVGVVIGTGIFVLTGEAAGVQAGPAVAVSFVVAGIACALPGTLLRRARVDGACRRERPYVLLRDDGRDLRVDHRVGPHPGARARGVDGGVGVIDVRR